VGVGLKRQVFLVSGKEEKGESKEVERLPGAIRVFYRKKCGNLFSCKKSGFLRGYPHFEQKIACRDAKAGRQAGFVGVEEERAGVGSTGIPAVGKCEGNPESETENLLQYVLKPIALPGAIYQDVGHQPEK
jgi:hypothetical protein